MAKPSEKSFEMEKTLSDLTGVNRTIIIAGNKCIGCGGEVEGFKDEISKKEYTISGLCQKCQDSIFG